MASKAPSKSAAKKAPSKPKAKSRTTTKRTSTGAAGTPGTSSGGAAKTSPTKAEPNAKGVAGKGLVGKGLVGKNLAGKGRAQARSASATRPAFVPRAVANLDDDDVLMAHGGGGSGFGRCGGRLLSSKLEQELCNRLGISGVVHSHSPRHYEVRLSETQVAAYAPMVVLRGRGREGKGVVIEAIEDASAPILRKIVAFRSQYGQEFYVILVATDDVLDDIPLAAFDESCASTNVNTLIARLAE